MTEEPLPARIDSPPPLDEPVRPAYVPRGDWDEEQGAYVDEYGRPIASQELPDGTVVDHQGRPIDQDKAPYRREAEALRSLEREQAAEAVKPCVLCHTPRRAGLSFQAEMSPVKALLVQQGIEQGLCFTCALDYAEKNVLRAARQLTVTTGRTPR